LATVYDLENHELYRKWVGLSDSTGKFSGVQGYLKLSMTAIGPGEEAPAHNEAEELDVRCLFDQTNINRMNQKVVIYNPSYCYLLLSKLKCTTLRLKSSEQSICLRWTNLVNAMVI